MMWIFILFLFVDFLNRLVKIFFFKKAQIFSILFIDRILVIDN